MPVIWVTIWMGYEKNMEYGVAFASELDSWKWTKRAEELGFSSAWFMTRNY